MFVTQDEARVKGQAAAPVADGLPADGPPAPADDLAEYREAIAKWDPSQFTAAVNIVLEAYGDDARA